MPTPSLALAEIASLLRKDEPRVVLVVGSGVSIGATGLAHASWSGLLRHGVQHLFAIEYITAKRRDDLIAAIEVAFSPFNLDQALRLAESIESSLQLTEKGPYAAWLQSAFEDFKALPARAGALEAIHALQQAGALVLTTNYDGLLEAATGCQPVTWQDHQGFLQVVNRSREAILHIHGHWAMPSSIVLGRSSYQQVLNASELQAVFSSLWLEWTWIYIGCGDGLDDENLGRLIHWGNAAFGASARADYFLGLQADVDRLTSKPDRPANLKGLGYPRHEDLVDVLEEIGLAAGSWPFQVLDEYHSQFRHPKAEDLVPFPSRQEYLAGKVPKLEADALVQRQLDAHGWAFVLGKASVGKTTLALRLATAPGQRDRPVFYLDLAGYDPETYPERVVQRLARNGYLVILDNANREPELTRRVWEIWRARPAGSRLLVVGTDMQHPAITDPSQDLIFFIQHPDNPAINVAAQPADLVHIVEYFYRRMAGPRAAALPALRPEELALLYSRFGSALGAFSLAVLGHLAEFARGNWDLPLNAATSWVRRRWLKGLDANSIENLQCICVFGVQELELSVRREALPHPTDVDALMHTDLLRITRGGKLRERSYYGLREPGWGPLILEAAPTIADAKVVRHAAASRHWQLAYTLLMRYERAQDTNSLAELFLVMEKNLDDILLQMPDGNLENSMDLLRVLARAEKGDWIQKFWDLMTQSSSLLMAKARRSGLTGLCAFIDQARGKPQLLKEFWRGISANPNWLLDRAGESSLGEFSVFVSRAQSQPQLIEELWERFNADPKMLLNRAWESSLADLSVFIDRAKGQTRLVADLWKGLNADPQRLLERAWKSPLDDLSAFIDRAQSQTQLVADLWKGINADPKRLLDKAWESALKDLSAFIDRAKGQPRLLAELWKDFDAHPQKLLDRAWKSPLDDLSAFLERAKSHPSVLEPLCAGLASEPDRLSQMVAAEDFAKLVAFLRRVPSSVGLIALRELKHERWEKTPRGTSLQGATSLAIVCEELGRLDLSDGIKRCLLNRANPNDHAMSGDFSVVAWLVTHLPEVGQDTVAAFLRAVCTDAWLTQQYRFAYPSALAKGLRNLGVGATAAVMPVFVSNALGKRVASELRTLARGAPTARIQSLQLLGCAALVDWRAPKAWLSPYKQSYMAELPREYLPHLVDIQYVQDYQYHLWLGLRVFAGTAEIRIPVGKDLIRQTLELWLGNAEYSSSDKTSASHLLDLSMIRWLKRCDQDESGDLLPDSEWVGTVCRRARKK